MQFKHEVRKIFVRSIEAQLYLRTIERKKKRKRNEKSTFLVLPRRWLPFPFPFTKTFFFFCFFSLSRQNIPIPKAKGRKNDFFFSFCFRHRKKQIFVCILLLALRILRRPCMRCSTCLFFSTYFHQMLVEMLGFLCSRMPSQRTFCFTIECAKNTDTSIAQRSSPDVAVDVVIVLLSAIDGKKLIHQNQFTFSSP